MGSEMCIRDRYSSTAHDQESEQQVLKEGSDVSTAKSEPSETVSADSNSYQEQEPEKQVLKEGSDVSTAKSEPSETVSADSNSDQEQEPEKQVLKEGSDVSVPNFDKCPNLMCTLRMYSLGVDSPNPECRAIARFVHEHFTGERWTAQPPKSCLLYTSPSPRDLSTSRMPSSA